MASYSLIPNTNYNYTSVLKTLELEEIEKIRWFKKVGNYLKAGDLLCEIHYNDCVLEIESSEDAYLIYQNRNTEVSFSSILFIYGGKDEKIPPVFEKHKEDLKHYDASESPIFEKLFTIENSIEEVENILID